MTTAFQRNAFQDNAFQIDPLNHEVRWPGTTVGHKRKKDKDSGPDLGLIRELQRQREEAAQRIAAEHAAQRAAEDAAAEERRLAEEAAQRGVEELKKSSGVAVGQLLARPEAAKIQAAPVETPKVIEQQISAAAEEEELVLLMLLAQ